jgi:CRP-like cAMP-binding protein
MRDIADLLSDVPAFSGLEAAQRELIAGCGHTAVFADGEPLFREGEEANTFFVIRRGTVALEIAAPARMALVIETLDEGELVGWSWLFAPYRTSFDARARGEVHALAFDGACLRGKCEDDHDLGYELMRRFAAVITERLQATRMRVLDLYGFPSTVA